MSEYLDTVREVVAAAIDVSADNIEDEDSLPEEHDVDSLMGLEVLVALEKKFKISIPEELLQEMTSVKAIATMVEAHFSGAETRLAAKN